MAVIVDTTLAGSLFCPCRRPPHATVRAQSVLNLPAPSPLSTTAYSLLPTAFLSTCPSPLRRRRQSPNGRPPPERARDRRGRRGVEGEECGGVSAGGMAVAPPVRRRAIRVRSPTTPPDATERGAEAADTRRTRTGLRAVCRGYPSGRRTPRRRRIRDRAGRPDIHLPIPRPGADPARRDAMSRRTRQTAQPVHAAVRAQPVHATVRCRQPVHAVKSTLFTHRLLRNAVFLKRR